MGHAGPGGEEAPQGAAQSPQEVAPVDPCGWYDANALAFQQKSFTYHLAPLYQRFLAHVPAGGRILDAGCGVGRDAAWFHKHGYDVTAFDGSPAMVRLARKNNQHERFEKRYPLVLEIRYEQLVLPPVFDAVWSCASLVHATALERADASLRLCYALKPGGVFFASLKLGRGTHTHEGRSFEHVTEADVRAMLPPWMRVGRVWSEKPWITVIAKNTRNQ